MSEQHHHSAGLSNVQGHPDVQDHPDDQRDAHLASQPDLGHQSGAESEPQLAAEQASELSLEELESEIAEAEALVQDLNQRLRQTADGAR
ncbi:hypothetical protein [Nesterenkonia sandarakina]|uniref:Uncharacterized protein n=1 Tax=Nesterenkonia sandarakina TaxID=272918 RepID=A0A2T0YDB3_9MICC|nr:hypothetical protein [Nesterenkonia sandarakina]PRZ12733.1 hypothetical protein BCL67_11929 [Nesterenkonia sandarakina]